MVTTTAHDASPASSSSTLSRCLGIAAIVGVVIAGGLWLQSGNAAGGSGGEATESSANSGAGSSSAAADPPPDNNIPATAPLTPEVLLPRLAKRAKAHEKVWLRGTNGRLAVESVCRPVPSFGLWRARCPVAAPDCSSTAAARDQAPPRTVVLQFASNDVAVTGVLCSGACAVRNPPFKQTFANGTVAVSSLTIDLGACPSVGKTYQAAAAVPGPNAATDVYLDVQVAFGGVPINNSRTCFLTVGDWGSGGPQLSRVASAMTRLVEADIGIRFIISTGDNFYPAGIKSIDDAQIGATFEQPFSHPLLKQMMWFISAGNHDQWGIRGQLDLSVTSSHPKRSDRWYFPGGTYSLEMPVSPSRSMRLVVLDTFGRKPQRMLQFLQAEMAESLNGTRRLPQSAINARAIAEAQGDMLSVPTTERWQGGEEAWRIVVNHAPMYSGSVHGQNKYETELGARPMIKPVVDKIKAHMYLSGHDHVLEVHQDDAMTDYFVSGGGGGSQIYPSVVLPTTKYYETTGKLGFMRHCFLGDKATTTVFGVDDVTKPLYVHVTPLMQTPHKG